MDEVKFGDYLAITNLSADTLGSEEVMRYESLDLSLKVEFQREAGSLFWKGLDIKYELYFEDGYKQPFAGEWLGTEYNYVKGIAIATFQIRVEHISNLTKIRLKGKRPSASNNTSDIREAEFDFSKTKIAKDLQIDGKNNKLIITEYSIYYTKPIHPSRKGDLITINGKKEYPLLRGTSQEGEVLKTQWHDGYIAIKPMKVKYMQQEIFPKFEIGLASSGSATGGVVIDKSIATFKPEISKWYYFKLPDNLFSSQLNYPIIKYSIGDYSGWIYHTNLEIEKLRHSSQLDFSVTHCQRELQYISDIEETVNEKGEKKYTVISIPKFSGQIDLGTTEVPFILSSTTLSFEVTDSKDQLMGIGKILFNELGTGQKNFMILEEPTFESSQISSDGTVTGKQYKDWEIKIKFKAKNIFTNQEQEWIMPISFFTNAKPIFFPGVVLPYISLNNVQEEEAIRDNKFTDKATLLEPAILNPYEKLSYQINLKKIYIPYLYSFGWDLNMEHMTFQIYEEIIEEENSSFSFENSSNTRVLLSKEADYAIPTRYGSDNVSYFKEYNNFINTSDQVLINTLNNGEKVYSLDKSLFLKIGIKVYWKTNEFSQTYVSNLEEAGTIRLGRTLPPILESSFSSLSSKKFTYKIKDYGGDKTQDKNYNSTVNSLCRNGKERLLLSFKKGEEEVAFIEVNKNNPTIENIKNILLEGAKREISFSQFPLVFNSNPLTGVSYTLEDLKDITKIEGKYYFFLKEPNEFQYFNYPIEDFVIVSGKAPSIGFRKEGVLINCEAEQQLRPVKEGGLREDGIYFIEINALNDKDKLILSFPNGVSGEIYCQEGLIHLKGFVLD